MLCGALQSIGTAGDPFHKLLLDLDFENLDFENEDENETIAGVGAQLAMGWPECGAEGVTVQLCRRARG